MLNPSAAPPGERSEQAALSVLIGCALRDARAAGGEVLLCYGFPLDVADTLALAEHMADGPAFRFYWEQPSAGHSLAAGGVARRFEADGANRFADIAVQVEGALAAAVGGEAAGGESSGPYLLGGFSFFEELDDDRWAGYGAAQLVVPAWVVLRSGDGCQAVVTTPVVPEDSARAVEQRVVPLASRLRAVSGTQGSRSAMGARNRAFRREEGNGERRHWLEMVRAARERIREGRLAKVVLARALDLLCEEAPSTYAMLHALRAAYPDCYSFLIASGRGPEFLGASPELLARFNNGTVDLAAVAGTVPRGRQPEADEAYARHLMDSRKEREEHQIVVDGIVRAVSELGALNFPATPQVLKLSNAQHLCTPITLKLSRPVPMLTLLERVHPTAAVGGHPREEALRLIRECERFERGWYAAPIGWMNARGQGEFAVALRAGALEGRRLRLFAGCGIVADSDPEREYEETQIKFQPLLAALAAE